jgi:uncharacterized protein
MKAAKKVSGEDRREHILSLLKESDVPFTGNELAAKTNVSRQVIVGDISLLKAKNEPILATSQGYIYMKSATPTVNFERTIACNHLPERTEEELNMIVDHGVTVKDVRIEHPVYGDLIASILVSNRKEVNEFMRKVKDTKASYLLELTNGIHLHTLSASSQKALDDAENALREADFLIDTKD